MYLHTLCDLVISEIQFEYEKLKFYDLLNGSMELVFQKIQKWDIYRAHKFGKFAVPKFGI